MPITLDVSAAQINSLQLAPGARITLRDPRDEAALAILTGMIYLKLQHHTFRNHQQKELTKMYLEQHQYPTSTDLTKQLRLPTFSELMI
jgi:hypothetical protein